MQGFTDSQIVVEPYLHLRYAGTDCALMVSPSSKESQTMKHGDFYAAFVDRFVSIDYIYFKYILNMT